LRNKPSAALQESAKGNQRSGKQSFAQIKANLSKRAKKPDLGVQHREPSTNNTQKKGKPEKKIEKSKKRHAQRDQKEK